MQILIVEPGKYPRKADIPNTLDAMQEIVQGCIEIVCPWPGSGVALVCNDEGLINGMELNRKVNEYTIIGGPFFLCGDGGENLRGLTDKQAEVFAEKLRKPHYFLTANQGVMAIETTPEKYALMMGKPPARHKAPRSADLER